MGLDRGPKDLLALVDGHRSIRLQLSKVVSLDEMAERDSRRHALAKSLREWMSPIISCDVSTVAHRICLALGVERIQGLECEIKRMNDADWVFAETDAFTYLVVTILNRIHQDRW